MSLSKEGPLVGCSGCIVREKPVANIQKETAEDYFNKTVAVGKTAEQIVARKRACLDGMAPGTFLSLPGECCRLPPAMVTGTECHTTIIERCQGHPPGLIGYKPFGIQT